ncbi:unnamed protein product [Rotaria sp. Silwood2]|nr:unnamed protein product [Rotaria sp. Silwood2]CAF4315371.1 unnamed protein product [Rotaria sp. Silwood2]
MASIADIIVALTSDRSGFQDHLTNLCFTDGLQPSSNIQAAYQAAAFELTLTIAIVSGLITGIVLRLSIFVQKSRYFDDEANWYIPEETVTYYIEYKIPYSS